MRYAWQLAIVAALAAGGARAADRPLVWADEVVVTATRFKDHYIDKPVNVTVISSEDIKRSAAKTVPDLLSEQAGIAIHDFFGNNAATTTVDMRGFGIGGAQNTLILVDGRRVSDIDLSGVQWPALPLSALERIEIVRGGGSVLYGDGATAGVINIITRSPAAAANGVTVQAKTGSYSTTETQLNANYFSSQAGFNLSASNFESDGYRANNHNRQTNALADFRLLTARGDITLKLGAERQGIRLPGARQVQPSAGVNQLQTDRRGAQTPLDYAQREGNRATFDWRRDTGFGEFNIGAGWRDKAQTSYFDFGGFPDYRLIDLDVWSFTPRIKIAQPLLGRDNTLVAGFDWYRWKYNLRRANSTANIVRPFNTVDATQETTALYLHNTTRISERATVTAGARRERLRIDATDLYDPAAPGGAFGSGAPADSQRESEYAYELGVRYRFLPGTALIGKAGRSYRFANVDEVYETSALFTNQFQFLRPQSARSHEIGMETRANAGWLRATLYTMEVRDEIHLDAFTTGIGNTNLPPSRRRGFELESKWLGWKNLTLGAAYTYTDARFREGALPGGVFTQQNVEIAGKTVPLVPRHKLNLHASWAMDAATRLNAIATYVSAQFMDNDEGNTLGVKIPSYTVTDLKLTHRAGPWTLGAAVNNLFDEKYYNYAVRSQFVADRYNAYPLPGRNIMLTLEYALR
jgi:iron complex outermembrane receptor protein